MTPKTLADKAYSQLCQFVDEDWRNEEDAFAEACENWGLSEEECDEVWDRFIRRHVN